MLAGKSAQMLLNSPVCFKKCIHGMQNEHTVSKKVIWGHFVSLLLICLFSEAHINPPPPPPSYCIWSFLQISFIWTFENVLRGHSFSTYEKIFGIFRNATLSELGGHPFSTYAKFIEKLRFLTPWFAHVHVRIRG